MVSVARTPEALLSPEIAACSAPTGVGSFCAGARLLRLASVAAFLLGCFASAGCNRAFYRQRADEDVYALVECGSSDPRWDLTGYSIQPSRASRMFDPNDPDCPPMPPDDPTSHQLMHCVDCKKGWPCWDANGLTAYVDSPFWREYLPYNEENQIALARDGAVALSLIHSRDFQTELEDLYLSALNVTEERFAFDTQYFGGNSTFFNTEGPLSGSATPDSLLSTATGIGLTRVFATGATLAVDVANSIVWQFAGPDGHTAITPLNFSLIQPLLRGAGRAVVLEGLTEAERSLLANIRQMERFRRGFYLRTVAGRNPGAGPSAGTLPLGVFAPGGGAGVGGYFALLEQQLQIRNQESNVVALRDSLERINAFYDAGRISRRQVDEILQNLYSSQINLLTQTTNYQDRLDAYKIELGLPPQLDLTIEDSLFAPLNLISPDLNETQSRVADLVEAVSETWARLHDIQTALDAVDQANQAATGAGEEAAAGTYIRAVELTAIGAAAAARAAQVIKSQTAAEEAENAYMASKAAGNADEQNRDAKIAEAVEVIRSSANHSAAATGELTVEVLPLASVVLEEALGDLGPALRKFEDEVSSVERDIHRLNESLPTRRENLELLAEREEFTKGEVDPGVADVAMLHRRVIELNVDFYGKDDPSVVQLTRSLLSSEEGRKWFRDLRDVAGLANELPDTLLGLTQLRDEVSGLESSSDDELNLWGDRLDRLRGLMNRLSGQILALTLVQAKARLDTATLTPVDMDPDEAIEIARIHRRDWMNARAALVDQWRQIEITANTLESDLDVTFDGDVTQTSDTRGGRHNTTGNVRLGLEFDAPLNRLAERNAYREELINYQRSRRLYYEYEDEVALVLRETLRSIRLSQLQFELERAAVHTAIDRVEQQQLELQRPPEPGEEQFSLGPTTARDLVTALDSLLREQNGFLNTWVQYLILRMDLDFDLGTMQLDDRGMWIDPTSADGLQVDRSFYPEQVPAPDGVPVRVPEVLPDLTELFESPELISP